MCVFPKLSFQKTYMYSNIGPRPFVTKSPNEDYIGLFAKANFLRLNIFYVLVSIILIILKFYVRRGGG